MTNESALTTAKVLVSLLADAKTNVNRFFTPILKDYIEFTKDIGYRYDQRDLTADTFDEYDNGFFYFTGDEIYEHGDYHTPNLAIPGAFVEDPDAFKVEVRQAEANRKARIQADKEAAAKTRVERLRKELAAAEASLSKTELDKLQKEA